MSIRPLQQLLGPVDESEFFETYWQQRSLLIQNRDRAWPFRYGQEDFFASIENCYHLKMAFQNADGQHKECDIEAAQARRMYEAGMTICATRVDQGNGMLRRWLDGLEASLDGGEFHMNSYLSPGGKGFGLHFDYHSVWVLQLEGSKRWLYSDEAAIPAPMMNLVYPLHREEFAFPWYTIPRPDVSQLREVVLEPGDMLYLPAGAWHQTVANGFSHSITMGHEPVQAARFVSELLLGGIWTEEGARRHMPVSMTNGACEAASEGAVEAALADAIETLQERLGRLTPEGLMKAWRMQVKAEAKKRAKRASARTSPAAKAGSALNPLVAALLQGKAAAVNGG